MINTEPGVPDPMVRILVVDDSEDMRVFFRRVLEKAEYQVTTAENGEVALGLLDREHFDLVLLDIIMPGMDGITALKRIRKNFHRKELPIIMVTVRGGDEDIEDAMYYGADEYIVKPISYIELLTRIKNFMAERVQEDTP